METKLSWDKIEQLSKDLAAAIEESGFVPDYLVGITVGGLIPLGLLAEELDIRNVLTVSASSYDGKQQRELKIRYMPEADLSSKKILLVDEVAETGQTLALIAQAMKEKYKPAELRTAALVVNTKTSKFHPDFSALKTEEWLDFPWEK